MKKGWTLLICSLICGVIGFVILGGLGGTINPEAADLYAPLGGVIGFLSPPIVYFGNRVK